MPGTQKFFFIHIMRTGGGTFFHLLRDNFGPGEVYPDPAIDADMSKANIEISYLLGLDPERHRSIRAYTGHFPFFVTTVLASDMRTATIVREPVQRTISFLQMKARETEYVLSPDDLYNYPGLNDALMRNVQTRQFALAADDGAGRSISPFELRDHHLAVARENLATVDVIGLHEQHDEFLDHVTERFGWKRCSVPDWHISEPLEISDSLRAQITEDNAMDVQFYDYAVRLHRERQGG